MDAESRAIIRSTPLIYWDGRKQAIVANWIDVEDHYFEPPALAFINELALNPQDDQNVAVAKAETKSAAVLDIYEAQLAKYHRTNLPLLIFCTCRTWNRFWDSLRVRS